MEISNINKSVVPDLVTYPRSGLHFFATAFIDATGLPLRSSHDINLNDKNIITIVRNPLDTIVSYVAMDKNYTQESIKTDSTYLDSYRKMYSWLITNATIVVDFNTMEDNINMIMENICDHFKLKKIREIAPKLILENLSKNDGRIDEYVIHSSKRLSIYNDIKKHWEQKDLSKEEYLYERLKERAIN